MKQMGLLATVTWWNWEKKSEISVLQISEKLSTEAGHNYCSSHHAQSDQSLDYTVCLQETRIGNDFIFFFSTLQAPLLSNTNISDLLYQKKLSGKQNSDPVVQQCYMDVSEKNITPYLLWRIFIARRLSSMSLQ